MLPVVELSALRLAELEPLRDALPKLDLSRFSFISVHAPSRFDPESEPWVIEQLVSFTDRGLPVIVHPDVIFHPAEWQTSRETSSLWKTM